MLGWGGDHGYWGQRVTFPYPDTRGGVPSIAGRTLDPDEAESRKWIVSGNSVAVRRKSELLWGLDRRCAELIAAGATPILVEGPGDAARILSLKPDAAVVAPVGVAVNAGQLRQIAELREGEVRVEVYADNDRGGIQMCKTLARLAPEVPELLLLDCRLAMPLGCDPGDLDDDALKSALNRPGLEPERLWLRPEKKAATERSGPEPQSHADANDRKERVKREASITRWVAAVCEMHGQHCLCPFHDDTNPSLHVNEETGMWNCYGCDAWGDVFAWVMRWYGVSFTEAVDKVAADSAGRRPA